MTSSSNGDLAFGGVRGYQSSYLVDGADNNNGFFSQARGRYRAPYQFSNEVVQEFRVSSNSYGAELGRAGGGVVNVVTKSGTNLVKGSLFGFFRDDSLRSQGKLELQKNHYSRQQFGGTIGGPIIKNKLFIFGDYQGLRQYLPLSIDRATVPTAKMRNGDFSELLRLSTPIAIKDPRTGTVLAGNVLRNFGTTSAREVRGIITCRLVRHAQRLVHVGPLS